MLPDTHPFPPPGDEIRTEAFAAGPALPAELPRRILVAPFGEVASTKGVFIVDGDAMREIVAAFTAHGADLPIDFEHQTLGGAFSSPSGLAPAAGWVKALHAVLPEASVAGASASDQEGARPQDIPQSAIRDPRSALS